MQQIYTTGTRPHCDEYLQLILDQTVIQLIFTIETGPTVIQQIFYH